MPDWDDLDLTPEARRDRAAAEGFAPEDDENDLTPAAEPGRRSLFVGIAIAALLVAGSAGLGVLLWRARPVSPPEASAPPAAAIPSPAPPAPDLPAPEAIALPPLGESDEFVRDLLTRLSSHPQVAAWAGAGDLVQRFTAAVVNVSAGESPAAHLRYLEPRERLRVVTRGGQAVLDPESYARFDAHADAVASLDAANVARAYRLVSPLLEAAHRELGHPEGGVDGRLAAALRTLLEVPVLEGDVRVRPVVRARLLYEYADPRLESLSPAQKQLLRMGPRNVRLVQAKLREVADALGLPLSAGR